MANEVMNYIAKIGVDGSEFGAGIQQMATGFMSAFGPSGLVMGAASVVGVAMVDLASKAMEGAKAYEDLSQTTGISTDALQRFHYAANLSGDSITTVDSMLNKLTLSMGEAKDATSSQAAAFKAMGINPEGKSTEEIFLAVAQSLTTMADKQKAATLATDILGKAYKDSLPYMEDYLQNQEKINNSHGWTKEQIAELSAAKDSINAFWTDVDRWAAVGTANAIGNINNLIILTNAYADSQKTMFSGATSGALMAAGAFDPKSISFTGIYNGVDEASKALNNLSQAPGKLVDPFKGWTAQEVELQLQTDKVTEAHAALDKAITGANTKENIDKVKELSAAYKEEAAALDKLLKVTTDLKVQDTTNPYANNDGPSWYLDAAGNKFFDPNAGITGQRMGMNSGAFSDIPDMIRFAKENTDSDYQSNQFLSQIRDFDPANQTWGAGANWMHTSENENISNQIRSLWQQYQEQKAGSQGFTQINYIQGDNAQQVTNQIAEATSRAMARQVLS